MIRIKKLILITSVFILFTVGVFAQTYNFDNCGSTGRTGPSSCSYSGDNSVSIQTQGYQLWDVPEAGVYRITAAGAAGGTASSIGGDGAIISGEFTLDSSEQLLMVVGQKTEQQYGAGGGTFVTKGNDKSTSQKLIIAGGGAGEYNGKSDWLDGSFTECAGGHPGLSTECDGEAGPTGDYSGGGGFLSSGSDSRSEGGGGEGFRQGAVGGSNDGGNGFGGFGGGGGGYPSGAGGYSGGGGSPNNNACDSGSDHCAEGGGSYNSGSNQQDVGLNDGHGYVEIELVEACGTPSFSDPVIQSPSYSDSEASSASPASFDTDVTVNVDSSETGPCGNTYSNSLDTCSVTVTGENGGSYSPPASVSGSTCEFSLDNADDAAWQPGEEVTIDISVTDDYGSDTATYTHSFVNTPPEVTGTSPSSGETVFNEQGVLVEADVVDWESYHTGDSLTVNLRNGDSFNNFYSTSTGGDSTVSSRWSGGDNTNEFSAMYGFDRGEEASYEVFVEDAAGASTTSDDFFTVEDAPEISGASPSGGAEGSTLSASIENPVETDHNDVIFRTVSNGVVGEDRIFTQAGTASTSVGDQLVPGNTYEWYVEVDDTASSTVYDDITYMFTVPEVLRGEVRDSFRIPTSAPEEPQQGNIWVEVDRLTWQGADRTWWLQFTGTVAENAAAAPGSLWIEGDGINWVGTTGEHRRYEGTEIGGTETAGVIWIDDYNGDNLLHYTDQDGNITVVDGN